MEPDPTPASSERRASLGCLVGILFGLAAAAFHVLVAAMTRRSDWPATVLGLVVVIPSGIIGMLFGVSLGRFMTTPNRALGIGAVFGLLLWGVVRFSISYTTGMRFVTDDIRFLFFTITGRAADVIAFLGVSLVVGSVFGFAFHLLQKRAVNRLGRGKGSMESPVRR